MFSPEAPAITVGCLRQQSDLVGFIMKKTNEPRNNYVELFDETGESEGATWPARSSSVSPTNPES